MLCLSLTAKSQDDADEEDYADPVVDSLLREYNAATSDTVRLRLCREIGYESSNPDTVIKYGNIGITLFDGRDSLNLAYLNGNIGWAYNFREQADSAIRYYTIAAELFKRLGADNNAIMYSVNLSRAHQMNRNYTEMWRTIYESLRIAQQNADTVNICYCYYTIANYYQDLKMKQQCMEIAGKDYQLAEQAHNIEDMGAIATIMSFILFEESDAISCRESIKWGRKALECLANTDDPYYLTMTQDANYYLTDAYLSLAELENNDAYIDSACYYIGENEKLKTQVVIEDFTIQSMQRKAMVKYARHDYRSAETMLHKAIKYACDKNIHEYDNSLYHKLSDTYAKLGDYRNATKYHDMHCAINNKTSGAQAMMEAAAFEVRSQVEQEQEVAEYEKQIAEKELEQERQHFRRMTYVSAAGGVAALAFVFFLLRMLHHTRKSNATLISHNEEIKAQNEELDAEKDNLLAINDKIRQSMRYARRIQMATVSSEAEIAEVFPGALVYYKPSEIVSGDWYWTSRLGSKRILALGGSAKSGVPGALVSMMTVNALKDTVGQLSAMSSVSPTAILRTVKNKIPESARNNAAGVTLCIFGRGSVRFAGVNQNAILLKNGNSVIMQGDKPGDMFHTVSEGDSVMLYSASTARELNVRGITPESFCQFISPKSHVEQVGAIEEMVSQRTQKDDITIVSIII